MAAAAVSALAGGRAELRRWWWRWAPRFRLRTRWRAWPDLLVVFRLSLVAFGPLGEEPGWRAFAMPRLMAKHSSLAASLVLGMPVAMAAPWDRRPAPSSAGAEAVA